MPAEEERGPTAGATEDLQAGEIVGEKLRLERHIARGGMGTVWEASHLVLRSRVAIKFLDRIANDQPTDVAEKLDRFRFEAQVSALLSSHTKHMVAVHDAGTHRGMPYLVMEFAPGRSLQDLLDESGRVSLDLLRAVAAQIGEALDAAHDAGIVHRDVKPGNILLLEQRGSRADGGVGAGVLAKLTDFGVAKPTRGRDVGLVAPKATGAGLIVGSPAYMSPEQISAADAIEGASDRWSLGVVLFEGLTGWLPFRGESMTQFALSITVRPHDPPTSVVEGLPKGLDVFFERALAKAPTARFRTCAEMSAALEAAAQGTAQAGPPTSGIEPSTASTTPRSSRSPVAAVLLVLSVGLGLGLGLWALTRGPESSSPGSDGGLGPSAAAVPPSAPEVAPPPSAAPLPSAATPPPTAEASSVAPKARPPKTATPGRPPVAPPRPGKKVDPSEVH